MDPSDIPPPTAPPAPVSVSAQCDECAAPVEAQQRYCVVCGAHRRHVNDPAARYLSQLSARARTTRAASAAGRTARGGSARNLGLGIALALALIPAAAAVGVLAGRSSNNDDTALIHELSRQQAAAQRAASATPAGTSTVASASGASGTAHAGSAGTHRRKATGTHTHARSRGHHTSSAGSHTATAISTAPPTQAQKQTGAKVTEKVQKSKGKSYVNGQSHLPGTVVVP